MNPTKTVEQSETTTMPPETANSQDGGIVEPPPVNIWHLGIENAEHVRIATQTNIRLWLQFPPNASTEQRAAQAAEVLFSACDSCVGVHEYRCFIDAQQANFVILTKSGFRCFACNLATGQCSRCVIECRLNDWWDEVGQPAHFAAICPGSILLGQEWSDTAFYGDMPTLPSDATTAPENEKIDSGEMIEVDPVPRGTDGFDVAAPEELPAEGETIEQIDFSDALRSVLPPITDEEYAAIKASIETDGQDVPIIVDQFGNIIDGLVRAKICEELGRHCWSVMTEFPTFADRLECRVRVNSQRRHLNATQRRQVVVNYLLQDAGISDNYLAELIGGGISKNTVADVRKELEAGCQIDILTKLRGKDGKEYPKKVKRIVCNTPRQQEIAGACIGDLPEANAGKVLDVVTAERRSKRAKTKLRGATLKLDNQDLPSGAITLRHCRFQDLQVEDGSVPLIVTDAPWNKNFMEQWKDLAVFANRVLKPGGIFVSYTGTWYLPEILFELGVHLKWQWMISEAWVGEGAAQDTGIGRVCSKMQPIVVFSNGGPVDIKRQFSDLILANGGKEKEWHPWQRKLGCIEKLVQYFSDPGDLVCDPCLGGGTTAIAARNLGRRFIGCDVDESAIAASMERLATEGVVKMPLADDAPECSVMRHVRHLEMSDDGPEPGVPVDPTGGCRFGPASIHDKSMAGLLTPP